ncbi:MAG: hypothetical protein AB1649_18870 [Chloroflexota bacterium]
MNGFKNIEGKMSRGKSSASEHHMQASKISFVRLLLLAAVLNVLAQAIHETGHMMIYQIYQRGPTWGFIGMVQVWDEPPREANGWVETSALDGSTGWLRLSSSPQGRTERLLAAAAGPLASLAGVILGLWVASKSRELVHKHVGLMLSLMTSFTMTAYYLRGPLRVGGDEFDIASELGISKASVDMAFGLAFVVCLVLSLRLLGTWRLRLTWLAAAIPGGMSTGLLLNIADQWVRDSVNLGSPFFQSIMGYSLPVLLTYAFAVMGIWVWMLQTRKILPVARMD